MAVYEVSTGTRRHFSGPAGSTIRRIRFSEDGALLLGDWDSHGIVAWRMDDGQEEPSEARMPDNRARILRNDPRPLEAIRAENVWVRDHFECPLLEEAGGAFARFEDAGRTLVLGSEIGGTHRRTIPLRSANGLRLSPDGAFCAIFGPSTVTLYRVADGRRLGKVRADVRWPRARFLDGQPELLVRQSIHAKDGEWRLVRGLAQAAPIVEPAYVELDADLGIVVLRTTDSVVAFEPKRLKIFFDEPMERPGHSELRADGTLFAASIEDETLPEGVPQGREFGVWNVLMDEPRLRLRLRSDGPIHLAGLSPDGRRILIGGDFGAQILAVPGLYPSLPPPSPPVREPEPSERARSSEFASTFARLRREGCPRCIGRIETAGDLPVCVRCGPLCPYCLSRVSHPCPHRVFVSELSGHEAWAIARLDATRPKPLSSFEGDASAPDGIPAALLTEQRPSGEVWRPSLEAWALAVAEHCLSVGVSSAAGTLPDDGLGPKGFVFAADPKRFVEEARRASDLLAARTPPPVSQSVEVVLWPFGKRVTEGAWSPDGRHVAFIASGVVRVCDATTGGVLQTLPRRSSAVREVDFSSDGSALSALYARSRTDWSLADGEPIGGASFRSTTETPSLRADGFALSEVDGARWLESLRPAKEESVGTAFARLEDGGTAFVFGRSDGKAYRRVVPRSTRGVRLAPDGETCALFGVRKVSFYRVSDGLLLNAVSDSVGIEGGRFLSDRAEFLMRAGWGWKLFPLDVRKLEWKHVVGLDLQQGLAIVRSSERVRVLDLERFDLRLERAFEGADYAEWRPGGTLMATELGVADPAREGYREETVGRNEVRVWSRSSETPMIYRTTSPIRVARLSPDGCRLLLGGDFGALIVRSA